MARKRKVAPNAEMLRLLEKRKAQEAEFQREVKALEAKQRARRDEVGLLAEECGVTNLPDLPRAELRVAFERIVKELEALPKAA